MLYKTREDLPDSIHYVLPGHTLDILNKCLIV
jgi:cation transport regulator ChaB